MNARMSGGITIKQQKTTIMKTTLTTALLFLLMIIGLKAQINIKETTVQPPHMKPSAMGQEVEQELCNYLANNITYPEEAIKYMDEGIVKIAFYVKKNGQLNDFKVIQSVSYECDQQVIEALKRTTKCWVPGKINHEPADMETTVSVKFDLTDTPTDEEISKAYYMRGIHRFYLAHNPLSSESKRDRKLTASIRSLNNGLKYTPNEYCILALKAMVYQSMGNATKNLETIEKMVASLESDNPQEPALVTILANKK